MSEKDYDDYLASVEHFAVDHYSASVFFEPDVSNAIWETDDDPHITINSKQNKRIQLYTLLHEVGHASLRAEDNYQNNYPYGKKRKNKSVSRRVDVLRGEVAAWDEGRKIAEFLKIPIDDHLWHNFHKKHLFEYVKWCYDPTSYGRDIEEP